MLKHPDDFIPFIPSADNDDAPMSLEEYERYCATIRDTAAWGGEPEILALCKSYNVPIYVIQGATPHIVVHDPTDAQNSDKKADQVVRISYHRRMYGLGEVSTVQSTIPLADTVRSITTPSDQNVA